MAKKTVNAQDRAVNKVYATLAAIAAVILLVVGGLAWWAQTFINDMVRSELAAQKIYFPENLDAEEYPGLQHYRGELVDTAPEAKAYANEYIGAHLKNIADGKGYAEVSAEAQQNPDNETLQTQRQSLFMGETLRGVLLGTGYAFGTVGEIARIASIVAFAGAAALAVTSVWFTRRTKG